MNDTAKCSLVSGSGWSHFYVFSPQADVWAAGEAVMCLRQHIKAYLTIWQLDRSAEEQKQQIVHLTQ